MTRFFFSQRDLLFFQQKNLSIPESCQYFFIYFAAATNWLYTFTGTACVPPKT